MKKISINRLLATTAVAAALALSATGASALPVLFGGTSVEGGGSDVANIEPGQTVTATTLLQLQAPDGSIVTIEPGSVFTMTGEGDSLSFELVSGAIRVASSGMPISVSKGGVTIATTGGAFSAFEGEDGGLAGRVNQGTATVANGGGERQFSAGQGYEASETSIAGTFTPPPVNTTQMTQSGPDDTNYSPADEQGSEGSGVVEEAAGGGGSGGGGGGSGGYGGTPPVTGVVVPVTGTEETGYVIAYAADAIGIDARDDVTVTIGSGGELNRYKVGDGSSEDLERNSNDSLERANSNGNVFIERWAGGETHGNYYNDYNGTTFSELGRTSYQGFHLMYGKPTAEANIPTNGVATYDLVAATSPTIDDGSFAPGTFDGELGILFGPIFKVGVDFTVDMPGDHVYVIQTAGGAAAPSAAPQYKDLSQGIFRLNGIQMAQAGAACPTSNCDASIYGLFTGDAGEDVGITYQIMDFSAPSDDLYRAKRISGAAVFAQGSYTPGEAPPPTESGEIDAPLGSGPYQVAFNGVFVDDSTIELDQRGALSSFVSDYTGPDGADRGDTKVADLWGNEDVTIGRWNDGTTEGYLATSLPADIQSYHYAVGTAATNLPTYGVAYYDLAAATSPTFADGGGLPGTLTGGMSIGYGSGMPAVGLDLEIDMPDDHIYVVQTPGGLDMPHLSPFAVYTTGSIYPTNSIVKMGQGTFTIDDGGRACESNSSCFFSLYGFVSGEGGSSAALNYQIWQSAYLGRAISGSAAFTTDGAEVASLSDPLDTPFADGNYSAVVSKYGSNAVFTDQAAVFGEDGSLISYQVRTNPGSESTPNIGTNGMAELGRNDDVMWGRWTGGETGGTGTYNGYVGADLTGDKGMHWIVGTTATDLPASGTAEYELAGYTAPVFNDGRSAPGTLSGGMVVAWNGASTKIGTDLDVSMAGDAVYKLTTTGGLATPSTSELTMGTDGKFNGSLPVTFTPDGGGAGAACAITPCSAAIEGQAFGQGGKTIGLGYAIGFGDYGITGSGVFTQAPPPPP